jgi:hypothetical protein
MSVNFEDTTRARAVIAAVYLALDRLAVLEGPHCYERVVPVPRSGQFRSQVANRPDDMPRRAASFGATRQHSHCAAAPLSVDIDVGPFAIEAG